MDFKSEVYNSIDYYFNNITSNIQQLAELLITNKKNTIIFLGVGKSYNVALQYSDLLKCINFKSIILDISKLLHGDLGFINKDNLVILVSNSGNTKELLPICESIIKYKTDNIILISSKQGELTKLVKYNFLVPFEKELKNRISLIPTNSVMNFIVYGNHLLTILIEKLNLNDSIYYQNHIFGSIGQLLTPIKKFIIPPEQCCILEQNNTIKDAIINMNRLKIGCAMVIEKSKIIGLITDRDIRVFLEKNDNLNIKLNYLVNTQFFFIDNIDLCVHEIKEKYNYIPIIINDKLEGIFNLSK